MTSCRDSRIQAKGSRWLYKADVCLWRIQASARPLKAIETLAQLSFGRLTERDVPAASDISFLFYSNLYRNPECIEKESICVASQVVGAGFSCQGERRWTRL